MKPVFSVQDHTEPAEAGVEACEKVVAMVRVCSLLSATRSRCLLCPAYKHKAAG